VGQADELGRASESCEAHVLFISWLRLVLKLLASGLWLWIMADPHVAESTLTSSNSLRSHASLPVLVPRCRQYAPKAKFANKSLESFKRVLHSHSWRYGCMFTLSHVTVKRFQDVLRNRFGRAQLQKNKCFSQQCGHHHNSVLLLEYDLA